ncbi:phage tail spike protein [Ammoniphilus sp. YIM 78166]|uniref:phage tail spike protein n=1 Tax=Ammoniphilus sp. YIM 78166 TaxID=1644106 RepID=UPI00106F4E98|nr:phage tail protein [Ammoniphilus sp. YIM 78166]
MKYPVIYDKMATNYDGYGVAILENAFDIRIFEKLNGEHTLEFSLPRIDEKWFAVKEDNFVKVEGQLYIIRKIGESRDETDQLIGNVFCEHIFFELIDEYIENLETFGTPQHILSTLLQGTRFTADAVRLTSSHQFTLRKGSPVKGINHLNVLADCEVKLDNFTVGLYEQIGNNNGIQFRYRKNLKSIRKSTDASGVITRLYVYGKDDLSIPPIDSPNIGLYPRPKKGEVTFSEIETTETLQRKGEEYLKKVETPKVTYEIDIVELKALAEFGSTESFALGDTVKVIDEELGINVMARIVEYEHYPFEPEKSRVVLANFIPGIEDYLSELEDTKRVVDQIQYRGRVNTYWLDGVIDALKNQLVASGAYPNAQVLADKGFLLENTDPTSPDYGALYLGPGIFAIANSKTNGLWNWRTFGTGQGFTADLINAGRINAALIHIGSGTTFDEGYEPGMTPEQQQALQEAHAAAEQAAIDALNAQAAADAAAQQANTKAAEAQAAAQAYADAQAQAARIAAEAHADGLITAEEQARIDQANAMLQEAKQHADVKAGEATTAANNAATAASNAQSAATNAQSTAEAAQAIANNSVQKGVSYNATYIDANGVRVIDAGGTERVVMGQYATGKYGIKVRGGEMYATSFRSGDEGSSDYTAIGSGDSPFIVVKGGRTLLDIWTFGDSGSFNIHRNVSGTADQRLQIAAWADALGDAARIIGRKSNGSSHPLLLQASSLDFHAPYMYMSNYGGNTDVTVYGRFYVTGNKNALHLTESFGYVGLSANESPEFRFNDEGHAQIVNGECKVMLDPIFLECIEPHTPETPWRVSATPYAPILVYVEEIGPDYVLFKEKDGKNGGFDWRISGMRRGFAKRYDNPSDDVLKSNWEDTITEGI